MKTVNPVYDASATGVPYAPDDRQQCDLCLGSSPTWDWAIEIKPVRMLGDTGKPNDNLPTHILSPYPSHRSAVTDCTKLASSDLGARRAILIYGYEYVEFPCRPPLAATSLETVDEALPNRAAIHLVDSPAANPREISSRSVNDNTETSTTQDPALVDGTQTTADESGSTMATAPDAG